MPLPPNHLNRSSDGHAGGKSTNYVWGADYWPHGQPDYYMYANNLGTVWAYNDRLELSGTWGVNNSANEFLFNEGVTRANDGSVTGTTLCAGGPGPLSSLAQFATSFGYDGANRLITSSDSGGWSRNFNYDLYGNAWVTGNSGVPLAGNTPTSNVYNSSNQMGGASYDGAGNQVSVNGNTATYDAENRLISVYEPSTHTTETYGYDGLGQRVQKAITGGALTEYAYDAFGQLASEYSPAGVLSKDFIPYDGEVVAVENAVAGAPCQTCYLNYDQVGNVRIVTDQNATVIARHDYLPYGEEIPAGYAGRSASLLFGATDSVDQRFTGQVRDSETGQDFFNARYYGAALGRFTSADGPLLGQDPRDPQSWNLYSYVRNRPINATDPTGHHIIDCAWDGCSPFGMSGGGGGGGAIIDGVQQTVFNTSGLGSNALAACPNGECSSFNSSGQYLQFTAGAGSAGAGYWVHSATNVSSGVVGQGTDAGTTTGHWDFEVADLRVSVYSGESPNVFGHVGIGVNSQSTFGLYPTTRSPCLPFGCSVPGVVKPDAGKPLRTVVIKTTPQQDQAAQSAIDNAIKNPPAYKLYQRNCASFVESVLGAAGVPAPSTIFPTRLGDAVRCQ
ncbi:MAG: hypothetical protein JOZ48_10845 [Acidobacteriaceae bacterium]|nr:hypothetical protein [Acidobacteriaceae bacterium]